MSLFYLFGCGAGTVNNTPQNNEPEEPVDISMFEGVPDVEISVDIEKDLDSHLLEVIALSKNTSNKKITKMILYHVKCYDNDTEMESWKYTDRLTISDIEAGETDRSRWVLGTTDEGATKYSVYIAYVLYEDGTQWGSEEIVHKAVVTRNLQPDVCIYDSSTPTTDCYYKIDYSAKLISNSHVGDNWSYGLEYNDIFVEPQAIVTIPVPENRGPRFTIYGIENDTKDDYGSALITFSHLDIQQSETIVEQVMIVENEGRYTGHKAYMEFTITCTRVDKSELPNNGNKYIFEGALYSDAETDTPKISFDVMDDIRLVGRIIGDTNGVEINVKWDLPYETVNQSITLDENGLIDIDCELHYLLAGNAKVEIYLDKTNEMIASFDFVLTD